MRVKDDSTLSTPSGDTAELLARRLSDAVRNVANGNGNGHGADNGVTFHVTRERARQAAAEVGAAILAETSTGTAEHSKDVVLISEAIGERMGIAGDQAGDLLAAARLHDIGKAWVPTDLLEKAGPLSGEDWELMHQHTVVGERILSSVEELREVARLVRHSHERWDGGGYPDGLAGPEIPLGSRIIFCADAFHAIRCDRPYRAGRSAREALEEISRCAGTQFDPRVAGALEQVVHERNRRPNRGGGSARLFALLMCLVLGGAGSAVARSGLLPEPPAPPAHSAKASSPPPGCGTAACPTVAAPVGGLGAVGDPGPRPLFPGLPGQLQRATVGKPNKKTPPGKAGQADNGKHKGQAKQGNNGNGKHAKSGHANASASHGNSAQAPGTTGAAPAYGSSGGSSQSSASHGSGGHSGSSRGHSGSRGRRGASSGSSHGNAGGNGNGNSNPHGN